MASYLNQITANYSLSLLSIPAYHLVSLLPHFVSINIATGGDTKRWRNANSRGQSHVKEIHTRLSPAQHARFERARAAHTNAQEGFPLFIAAVLAGNLVALAKGQAAGEALGVDTIAIRMLLARLAYTVLYLVINDDKVAYLRTLVWGFGIQQSWKLLIGAARALAN